MDFNYNIIGQTLVVSICGEIDQHSAQKHRNKIDLLLKDETIKCVIFDMSHITFMDSSGIGLLLGRYKLMKKRHGTVGVYHLSDRIDQIIRLSGLYQIIKKYESKKDFEQFLGKEV